MKTTELNYKSLMIGDLVSYNGTPIKVENIHGDCINYSPDIPYVQEEFFIDIADVKPIPLTAEILEKNGFKKYEEDYHNEYVCEKCDETSYYEVVICWKDSYDNGALDAFNHVQWDEGWKLDIVSEGSYNKGWCKTIYLHELQHALRLCGLSDLADNLKLEE